MYTTEPEQQGPRRVIVNRAGEIGVVGISWKSPSGRDTDYPALDVLATILSSSRTSRFYRALTDRNLALRVSRAPGPRSVAVQVYAMIRHGVEHAEVEAGETREIERVAATASPTPNSPSRWRSTSRRRRSRAMARSRSRRC